MIAPAFPDAAVRRHGIGRPEGGLPPYQARLVIGYGNDLRCDDGAGIRAARIIAAQEPLSRVIICHQLTPDLACDIVLAVRVMFIDAYRADECGAQLLIQRILGGDAAETDLALLHRSHPEQLLGLARRLFGRVPEAWVIGIPAYCFDAGEVLSAKTAQRIDEAVALFRQ